MYLLINFFHQTFHVGPSIRAHARLGRRAPRFRTTALTHFLVLIRYDTTCPCKDYIRCSRRV